MDNMRKRLLRYKIENDLTYPELAARLDRHFQTVRHFIFGIGDVTPETHYKIRMLLEKADKEKAERPQ